MEKKWEVKAAVSDQPFDSLRSLRINGQTENRRIGEIISLLLENRGLDSKKKIEEFFNPPPPHQLVNSSTHQLGVPQSDLQKAAKLIKSAVAANRPIVIHGDYDVDGICATAILWEAIYKSLHYTNVLPFIPNRFDHGYGLSVDSVDTVASDQLPVASNKPLLITVDCGITAVEEVEYAKEKGFEVIITDHHQKGGELLGAAAIVWTDEICAAGIAFALANALKAQGSKLEGGDEIESGLDLVALATIADLVPLLGPNRSFARHGLEKLNRTTRTGLLALIETAGLKDKKLGTYEVGWIIGPRLNAAGRLADATNALRLLCTREDKPAAAAMAKALSQINSERQSLTEAALEHAKLTLTDEIFDPSPVLILDHESYHEGVIGLVAGKLAEELNRPAVAISRGEEFSKGSARSVNGFNIVEALRSCEDCLEGVGGHPMAAGFTIKTEKIGELRQRLTEYGSEKLDLENLKPVLKIDCEADLENLDLELCNELEKFQPFGMGNPEPKFLVRDLIITDLRPVGRDGKHLKLGLSSQSRSLADSQSRPVSAIAFNQGGWAAKLLPGDRIDTVCNLRINEWNNHREPELRIKDLRSSASTL